ncbi:MAG: hypothetical protein B6U78_02815 [Candidatus Aenigmarchaeota archaeon ex4484_224]|nr:MAG: hypothetical protein B6U78_02815 [Candidatus Aenigmarchaeota archaeon ex4484_224]
MKTYIKKLILKGFKSFNKRTSIPFLPGFNVISGPNGSGKSNILDAIAFVLGTLSAKSLRSQRLTGLIFHGTEKTKGAEYASVTLVLDNSKRIFPFDEEEIVVERKINKKGVSVYRLNGRNTTREKILQVLSIARIYPNGHNIIMQGDITKIIEMNPIERREIIDEIAGIAEYNEKKEKALKNLEEVEKKLREAEIILSQKLEIFKKLEKERNVALKYKELSSKLRLLKASFFYRKIKEIEEEINKLREKLEKKENEKIEVESKLEEVEKKLEEKEKEIKEIVEKVVGLTKKFEIEKKVSELRSKLLIKRNNLDVKKAELQRIDSLIDKLQAIRETKIEEGEIPRAVRTILKLDLKGVYGTIADLIETKDEYKIAIEVAAGPHLYDIVVENEDVASFCIEYLRREKIGRATFLPLNKIKPNLFKNYSLLNYDGVIGVASKLIKFNIKFLPAMEFVFGNTLIVRDLEVAKAIGIGKVRMVTLDGDLIERTGAMVGGYIAPKKHIKTIESSTEKEIESYMLLRRRIRGEINELEDEIKEIEKELEKYSKSKELKEMIDLEKVKISSEKEIERLRSKRKKLIERKINLEIGISSLKTRIKGLEEEKEKNEIQLQAFEDIKEFVDSKSHEIERMIKKTESELNKLGPINFKAIEEYESYKREFDKYKEKYEKILEEKKKVLEMIEEIEEKKKKVFMETLEKVSEEFNEIFRKMTNGSASLRLEEEDNVESGLLIEASPGGKKLLNIDAMSGGEKTLTALAFILALQRYNPSPFYIFDEVDATLDKENSKKVGEFLKDASKNAQFIIITHNDEVIKRADRIYGVTMIDGESKIVALELPK